MTEFYQETFDLSVAMVPSTVTPTAPPLVPPPEPLIEKEPEPAILSVGQLNRYIRDLLEGEFPLVWIRGEISNFKAHTSGHFYFTLKDSKAQVSAVMFRGFNGHLKFRPADGMEVIVRGKITVYEPRGNYQLFCELMEPVGAGALQKAFEQLKSKLDKEGLFAQAKKRPLPAHPKHIAIVTSPTGAAIRDMMNVLARRNRMAKITLVPCRVQGDSAAKEIVAALKLAQKLPDVEVIICGRGGGSIEDMWCFNEEIVARAIAACRVPIVSAVGHEIDYTIADFVADLRAPTPSAAAELVVKSGEELIERTRAAQRSLRNCMIRRLQNKRHIVVATAKRLVDPRRKLQDISIRCDDLSQRLEAGLKRYLKGRRLQIELCKSKLGNPMARVASERKHVLNLGSRLALGEERLLHRRRDRLAHMASLLDSLSPLRVLDRGYAMVKMDGRVLKSTKQIEVGSLVEVSLAENKFISEVKTIL